MIERRNKITTAKQFETLISELEKNPTLVPGTHRRTTHVNNFKHDWEDITKKLNALGPPMRSCDEWLRVWKDFKFKLRRKLQQKEAEERDGGLEKYRSVIIYPLEKQAAKLINLENQRESACQPPIDDDHTIWEEEEFFESSDQYILEEVKTEDYCMMDQTILGDEDYLPSTSVNSFQAPDGRKRKRTRKCDQRQELLEKHSNMQENVFTEISATMNELKDIIKDSAYCQRKMLEIEEQKLEIIKRRQEREEELYKCEMKLKLAEIKIKTKELEVLEKASGS